MLTLMQSLRRVAVTLAVLGIAVGGSAPAALAESGPDHRPALSVELSCSTAAEGYLVQFTFQNSRSTEVARSITVYRDDEELFGDDGFTPPGESNLTYGPLDRGFVWRIKVTYKSRTIADQSFPPCGKH